MAALKVDRLQRRNTEFVTLPIVALAAASFAVVIASVEEHPPPVTTRW